MSIVYIALLISSLLMAKSRKYVNYYYHSSWTNAIKGHLSAKQYAPLKVLDIINKIDDDTGCLDFKV